MLREDTKISLGIYRSGSSVRVVAECDLITQENGHKDEAIYLVEVSVMKDPREDITDTDIARWKDVMTQNFRDSRFGFKAKDRDEADTFIKFNTSGKWDTVREFAEV